MDMVGHGVGVARTNTDGHDDRVGAKPFVVVKSIPCKHSCDRADQQGRARYRGSWLCWVGWLEVASDSYKPPFVLLLPRLETSNRGLGRRILTVDCHRGDSVGRLRSDARCAKPRPLFQRIRGSTRTGLLWILTASAWFSVEFLVLHHLVHLIVPFGIDK